MDVKTLGKITKWMETTDLNEVVWKKGANKFSLKVNGAQPQACNVSTHSSLIPVNSPSIGIFRFAIRGKSCLIKEGNEVKKGQDMGIIEIGKNFKPVKAQENGFVKIICIEDGKTVEYGQPLFFLEPK
ncbi:MAG: biotin/lipoyl-containing protein [Elusimicrobiota bacterium]|nr:biotin/lipoyl-containing protein [Elusimicrobiota bacterium]